MNRSLPNLLGQQELSLKQLSAWYEACEGDVEDNVVAVFNKLAAVARHPKWRDCGFMRTVAELAATPGHPAIKEARSRSGILRINHLASLAKPALLKQETTICLCSTGIFD